MASVSVGFKHKRQAVNEPIRRPENISPKEISLEQRIIMAIRSVYDPEIPVNVYDLGLIYSIQIDKQAVVFVDMTLTAPTCPVAGSLPGQVECAIKAVDGVNDAYVVLVWDPPWSQDCMSDEAKLALGLL